MPEIKRSFRRYEKKFLMTPDQYEKIAPQIRENMDNDIYPPQTVCNIYYDTPSYQLIRTSIDRPVYREKFRVRSYGVPQKEDMIYAEIKKKYNGIVYKRRIEANSRDICSFLKGDLAFNHDKPIQDEILWFIHRYDPKPKVFIGYEREAFMGRKEQDLRVTFDRNLRWRAEDLDLALGDEGENILPGENIIMEIKIEQAVPLWLARLLSENEIFPVHFSKYGTCYLRNIAANPFQSGGNNYAGQYTDNTGNINAPDYMFCDGHDPWRSDFPGIFI